MKVPALLLLLFTLPGLAPAQPGEQIPAYPFLRYAPEARKAFFKELYQDALDPYRHLTAAQKYAHQRMHQHADTIIQRISRYLYVYLMQQSQTGKPGLELKDIKAATARFDGLRTVTWWLTGQKYGCLMEVYNQKNQMVALYVSNVLISDIEHLPGVDPEGHAAWLGGTKHNLYVFGYNQRGRLDKVAQYRSDALSLMDFCSYTNRSGEVQQPPLPLPQTGAFAGAMLLHTEGEAVNNNKKAYYRAYADRGCNHSHICCSVGCPCCGQAPPKFNIPVTNRKVTAAKPDFVKKLPGNNRLEVYLGNDRDIYNPRYEFTDARGRKKVYYSTLSNTGFVQAWQGDTRLAEYNAEGLAWVMQADRKSFCRINRMGNEVPVTIDTELLGTANITNTPLGDGAYALELDLHEHLPDITDSDNNPIMLTALVTPQGQVVPGSIQPRMVRSFSKHRVLLGEYDDLPLRFGGNGAVPGVKWYVCNSRLEKLSPTGYRTIDVCAGEWLARVHTERGYGFVDTTGREVIPCQWDMADIFYTHPAQPGFFNGKTRVYKNGKCGVINTRGELVLPLQFEKIDLFAEGLAAVRQKGLYGYMDTTGKLVIPCIYSTANYFSGGRAAVDQKNAAGANEHFYINTKGERLPPPVK